jgi:predicted RNA methylase
LARPGRKLQRTPPAAQYDAIAELYDGYPGNYTEDLVFYAGEALAGGSPVLEIGAGTGRLTLGLAALGLEVVALDNSAAALQVLERKRAQAGGDRGQVSTVVADMREFDLGRTFTRVLVPFRTFLYLLT